MDPKGRTTRGDWREKTVASTMGFYLNTRKLASIVSGHKYTVDVPYRAFGMPKRLFSISVSIEFAAQGLHHDVPLTGSNTYASCRSRDVPCLAGPMRPRRFFDRSVTR